MLQPTSGNRKASALIESTYVMKMQNTSSCNQKLQVAGLPFADGLAVGATTIIGLQKAISCTTDFCEEWSLKILAAKTKIVVFKEGGRPSTDEKWWLGGEEIEVVKEIK
jgi:hypothetical protein